MNMFLKTNIFNNCTLYKNPQLKEKLLEIKKYFKDEIRLQCNTV